ncbi:MAG: carbamoyltransferase HypF [Stellaceae bacterium]
MPARLNDGETIERVRLRILVRGAVQGVGFRPFVHRQATALGLAGWVINSSAGVVVEAEGDPERIAGLVRNIREGPPANATVDSVETCAITARWDDGFEIRASDAAGACTVQVLPDFATCTDCLAELFDPTDRRYRYPFINCTHCGPRYSIIEDIPYDRALTSMRRFAMCPVCRAEYDNPADRRFHAEPNACADCGPRIALWNASGTALCHGNDVLIAAAAALRAGSIVAVKGIGGFHLVVDARDEAAVRLLRARKRRAEKPFAVMFPSLADVAASCRIMPAEEALLIAPARPIVLLRRTGGPLAAAVAPGNPWLGALLPYAPLHHLLMRELGFPVVATSGNMSDEPIVSDEREALERLGRIADVFIVHDRPIVRPVDDSVARVVCGRELLLRRARGYVPAPITLKGVRSGILAMGGHLKSTVALTHAGGAVLSQHIGDLETIEARAAHARAAKDLVQLHAEPPVLAVRDLHPDYASTRAAEASGLPVLVVQHHLAHVTACMAEHGIQPPVLGVAWDGTGYGPDGTVWGGEFLLVAAGGWRRFAKLRPFRLPGGDRAIREPRRTALGLLYEAYGERAFEMTQLAPISGLSPTELDVMRQMLVRGLNAPVTSSAGRLFDGFAALAGLRQTCAYEGQAAIELEGAVDERATGRRYPLSLRKDDDSKILIVDWAPALGAALADLRAGVTSAQISEAFHNGLATAIADVAVRAGERIVALTGGCFQNARLTEAAVAALRAAGLEAVWHRRVPPNDGGLALGQAAWAAWLEKSGEANCA